MGIYAPVLGFATPALIAPVELFFESVSFVVWSAFH